MITNTLESIDHLRGLLYPLGFVSALAFGARFLVQWLASERAKQSVSIPLFWKLSIVGNITLCLHSVIQLHLPMCILQALHTVLSWRNLNLMQEPTQRKSLSCVIMALILALCMAIALFFGQTLFLNGPLNWIQAPYSLGPSRSPVAVPFWIHLTGILGIAAFSLRFWIQWWHAERKQVSEFSEAFWWVSLFGAFLSAIYFIRLIDFVNFIGPTIALIPYSRNLLLMRRSKQRKRPLSKNLFFVIAGETSASLYGASLMHQLKQKNSCLRFYGCGGEDMNAQGLQPVASFSSFQVMGISSVIAKFPKLMWSFYQLKRAILQENAECVVFIDQPSFSLRLARALRKRGFAGKIVQYVAPTVWAYKKDRAFSLEKDFDLLLTLYPFEPAYFSHTTLPCTFCGHPLAERIQSIRKKHAITPQEPLIALFPGSRLAEVKNNLSLQLEAASAFQGNIGISLAKPEYQEIALQILHKLSIPLSRIQFFSYDTRYELMQMASCAIAKSGTVTLELALFSVPTVVTYSLSLLNYIVAKYVYKLALEHYCIVNILLQKSVFPECIGYKISPNDVKMKMLSMKKNGFDAEELYSLLSSHGRPPSVVACEAILQVVA